MVYTFHLLPWHYGLFFVTRVRLVQDHTKLDAHWLL